ncbi:DUF2301 domain-containing membrane protein [Phormidium sp. LEGE 05292]|uniref:DUF2301 domain-containing membrane protein n=1 Tax=[Phormidium] sp. LEGE 05292 TaxID=767427 RepID=UPI00187E6B77|nr:DUF2301 domain-containing membrane protein [Phormidium sp. LEGE 05292]MBE9224404.1 DUF2301 domain-containing membrane protein [Phormidium sp. LEGE 05292]
MTQVLDASEARVYQGQFGEFTITQSDRTGVIIYRASLIIAALSFATATWLVLVQINNPITLNLVTLLYATFCIALGVSLFTIHIYMAALHRTLQIFWGIGVFTSIVLAIQSQQPLALYIYQHPLTILGVGFLFAALTGIYFKEAFCFNRLETKVLTPIVPLLLVGHLFNLIPPDIEQVLLAIWAVLFVVFAGRKILQEIPQDIGDKSVFEYLKNQPKAKA